jgi:flagellar hook-associated protein 2
MPSISSAGIGSGLDVQSIVSQLMAIERQPLQRLQVKQNQLESQISAYGQLSSTLSTFQDAMDKLGSESALKVFTTTSTNPDVIGLTASSSADLGTFGVEVVRLAQHHKMTSVEHLNTDTFGGGAGDSISIQVGSELTSTITVDLSTASTLQDIRNAINDDVNNPGVQATIINGDDGYQKLVLTADESGSDNALTLTYGGSISAASFDLQTFNDIGGDINLLDAEVVVDGYTITRSTNDISNIISGVTLNLVNANPGVTHTIGIERDLETVKESVQGFADAFNELRSSIKSLRNGLLEADSSLLSIERQIFGVLNNPASGGVYSLLSEVGLTMQKDGTMSLDSGDLEAALQNDFNAVAQLFSADAVGFANRLSTVADTWLGIGGLLESRTDGLNARIGTLEDRQVAFERNLSMVEARYLAQFSALDALVGQLQGTGQFLTQQLAALPGANRN